MIYRNVALALPLLLLGCVSLEQATSGPIGCPASEIRITDKKTIMGQASSWTAECRGKTYYCSAQGGGQNTAPVAVCKEAATAGSESQPAAAGCQYDTQCKGERICRAGACVAP